MWTRRTNADSNRRGASASTLAKYALLQLPGLFGAALVLAAGVRWWDLSLPLAGLLLALWIAKDAALYPVLRIGYEPHHASAADAMMGARGVAQEEIAPGATGYVKLGGELWRAELDAGAPAALRAGDGVRVTDVRDLTLCVEAAST